MYLSLLLIDVGGNPDRPRPGRQWLGNIYHVHQRLCMGFASPQQRNEDPQFLRPFNPDGFGTVRFLFRIDNGIQDGARALILVQSGAPPDWDYAFQNAGMFLAAPPQVREYNPTFADGKQYRFRIRINLSKKSQKSHDGTDLQKHTLREDGSPRTQSKRVALTWDKDQEPDDAIRDWFGAKSNAYGFAPRDVRVLNVGWVGGYRAKNAMRFRSALLEGTLAVTDPEAFSKAVASGLGSAKAFGFGLLSVCPL